MSKEKGAKTEYVERRNNVLSVERCHQEEIDLLKEDNHFPGTYNFSMVIVSIVLTLVTKL